MMSFTCLMGPVGGWAASNIWQVLVGALGRILLVVAVGCWVGCAPRAFSCYTGSSGACAERCVLHGD